MNPSTVRFAERTDHDAEPRHRRATALPTEGTRSPLPMFFALVAAVVLPVMSLPVLAHRGVIPGDFLIAGFETEKVASLLATVTLLAVGLWAAAATSGRRGVADLLRRTFDWRIGFRGWAVALLALPVMTVGLGLLFGESLVTEDLPSILVTEAVATLIAFGLINLWEETIWAGLVQTQLERRHRLASAAVLTALPFALVHLPLQFIDDGPVADALANWLAVLVMATFFRMLIGTVMRGLGGSVFAVALLHTMFNRSNNSDGIAADFFAGDSPHAYGILATLLLLAGTALIWRHRPGRTDNAADDEVGREVGRGAEHGGASE